jgi:Tat protein translocase TatB subunit
MSGIGFSEFLVLCMIGLIVLGPKRLPKVAHQLGTWVGQARRMTRVLKRQLEEELDLDRELGIKPRIQPPLHAPPRDDDAYSPLHADAHSGAPGVEADEMNGAATSADPGADKDASEADGEKRRDA